MPIRLQSVGRCIFVHCHLRKLTVGQIKDGAVEFVGPYCEINEVVLMEGVKPFQIYPDRP
jgi:hypothetical protein